MYRIGVVGPSLSVKRIIKLARENEQEMKFIPYPYKATNEVEKIVTKYDHQVDFWLFSGYIPYKIAKKVLVSDENLVYILSTESCFYKGIMDLTYSEGKMLERISIDVIAATSEAEKAGLPQLEFPIKDIFVKTFDVDIEHEELFNFHYDLWTQNKTEGALTCYPAVYQELIEAGVPAYWISPTKHEILQTIRIFMEKIKTSYYKDTQIGVEMIEMIDFDTIKEKMRPYQLQYLELRLKETLLQLCEKLDGYLLEQGNGRYSIFSSRGAIEREVQTLQEKVEILCSEADTTVAVGIGFGQTVFSAEVNAHRALRQSKENENLQIAIVQDDGTIIESAGQEGELTYSYRTDDKDFLEKLKKGNISVRTFKKIDALIRKMGWSDFTTKDLALHLQMTERNAQRIVADLCRVDLVDCIGEESQSTRGRPKKIYRLK
ncbi:hypothetical protein [Bacillus sp. JJ722]|uniref:hypothetical protein n=1 Tax=Bacillus sp. JJ722 TaxID=3122973 RepID=UPI002FFE041A